MNDRGVSPVLGMVLLLGLTTVVALSLLLLSATMIGQSQSETETQQAERSLGQLAASADRIAAGEVERASFEVGGSDDASRRVDADAGAYEVRVERENGTEILSSGDLGVYRYTDESDTTVAFQGGGVWRSQSSGDPQMVRAPQFHYRSRPTPTLTLPIVRIADDTASVADRGSLALEEQRDVYPAGPNHTNPLREGVVYVTVESEFCPGWEEFFRTQTDGAIAETCATTDETGSGAVMAELSVPLRLNGLEYGVWTQNADIHKHADVEKIKSDEYDATSVDTFVDNRREDCREQGYTDLSGTIDESGLHCTTVIDDHLVVDTDAAGDDVEIFARDGMEDTNDVRVDGSGGDVAVFFGDGVEYGGGSYDTTIGNDADATQTRLYFNSSSDFYQAGDGDIYALVYAPRSRFYVHASGSGVFDGAIVAREVDVGSASVEITYDPGFEDVTIVEQGAGEPFYYLHVTETTLSFDR